MSLTGTGVIEPGPNADAIGGQTASKAPRPTRSRLNAVLAALLSSVFAFGVAPSADAQQSPTPDRVAAGRAFALLACTGCHVVAPDQPFAPVVTGSPQPPDFRSIANMPNTTTESLRTFLATLPAIPPPQRMANLDLSSDELENVVAYIVSLRMPSSMAVQPKGHTLDAARSTGR